jgi:beta-lactam-binding protein with PASTA domain
VIPDFRGMGIARALAAAQQAGIAIEISGTGRVVEQRPPPGHNRPTSRVLLRFSEGEITRVP